MFVPVVLAFNDHEPYDRIVHLAERLIVPLVLTSVDAPLNIDAFQRL